MEERRVVVVVVLRLEVRVPSSIVFVSRLASQSVMAVYLDLLAFGAGLRISCFVECSSCSGGRYGRRRRNVMVTKLDNGAGRPSRARLEKLLARRADHSKSSSPGAASLQTYVRRAREPRLLCSPGTRGSWELVKHGSSPQSSKDTFSGRERDIADLWDANLAVSDQNFHRHSISSRRPV